MPSDRRILPAGDFDAMREGFAWRIGPDFAIHRVCCDDWAEADPGRAAIVDLSGGAREVWSFGRLRDTSERLAGAMAARGVGRGDVVALLMGQSPWVMAAHFAAYRLGAIALPLFTLFGEDALRFRLADSGARLVVTEDGQLDKLLALAAETSVDHVFTTGSRRDADAAAAVTPVDHEIAAHEPLRGTEAGPDDPAVMIYTSGTTGPPKGALHAHRFLMGHLPGVEMVLERPGPGDVGWTPADWAWIGGLMDLAMPCLYWGLPLVAHRMRKFAAADAAALVANEGVTVAFIPPTALRMMRAEGLPKGLPLRAVGSGGESLGADLLDWGEAQGFAINELYGQTECNMVVCSMASAGVRRAGRIGRAVPGHEVAVLGPEGPVTGSLGEIAVRRPDPAMFLGYWNQPEKTAAKFRDDWLLTGDLGEMDADGYIAFASRDDDVITSAGYRIGPSEIEACLVADPDVVMAAVVGVPDPERTEIVKAFVVLKEGAARDGAAERLVARVRASVSPHVAPRAVEFVDSLPTTATGKILRRELRDRG